MKDKKWLVLLALIIFLLPGCQKLKEEDLHFGIDINRLNPLVMTAVDFSTGEKVFSRDPSIINTVTLLFENMKYTPSGKTTNEKGVVFTATTMFGDFTFGECWGNRLRLNGEEYTLERDYSKDINRLYERLSSETEHTAEVSREKILAVTKDMTFRNLLDSFGETLETAVVGGEERAWLYKYNGRPFYIRYKKEYDKVNMTGDQLLEQIWSNYNLAGYLSTPQPIGGGRLSVYKQAFDRVLQVYLDDKENVTPTNIILDTDKLIYLNDSERQELISFLKNKYSPNVNDSELAMMVAQGDLISDDSDQLVIWIKHYSYIGEDRMSFVAAVSRNGQSIVTENLEFNLKDNQWEG